MLSFLLAALVTCGGIDDTAQVQQAVDLDAHVQLVGHCRVNGWAGVRIPSGKTIDGGGTATVTLIPGCTSQGWPCRIFETIPGATSIAIRGLTLYGEISSTAKYQTLIRADSVNGLDIEDVACFGAKSDCVYAGGNTPSRNVRVRDLVVDGFGRNGISATNVDGMRVEGMTCRNSKLGADPGACIDVESNPGESVANITIVGLHARVVEKGVYMHRHSAALANGRNLKVLDSDIDAKYACVLSNSGDHVAILDTTCKAGNRGISVGGHYENQRSHDVIVWGNTVNSPMDVVLAGCRDIRVESNKLNGGGRVVTAALGAVGKLAIDNDQPVPEACPAGGAQ